MIKGKSMVSGEDFPWNQSIDWLQEGIWFNMDLYETYRSIRRRIPIFPTRFHLVSMGNIPKLSNYPIPHW